MPRSARRKSEHVKPISKVEYREVGIAFAYDNRNYVNICKWLIINNLREFQAGFSSHFRLKNRGIFPFLMKLGYYRKLLILNSLYREIEAKISNKNQFRPSSKVDTLCK